MKKKAPSMKIKIKDAKKLEKARKTLTPEMLIERMTKCASRGDTIEAMFNALDAELDAIEEEMGIENDVSEFVGWMEEQGGGRGRPPCYFVPSVFLVG